MYRLFLLPLIVLILTFGSGCEPYYQKDFYERISGMPFPKTARAIESMDNGEFVTITVFKVDSLELLQFIKQYRFSPVQKDSRLFFWGAGLLKKHPPDYTGEGQYYQAGKKSKNSWMYLADLPHKKLWAEIGYPDRAGD